MKTILITKSGQHVDFLNPDPATIRIDDIAWVLAKTCRYNSHLKCHYSNAEHSILAMHLVTKREHKRQVLIHDAAEYIFGDLPGPIKLLCPDYNAMIKPFEEFLNLMFLGYRDVDPIVHVVDQQMTATELFHFHNYEVPNRLSDVGRFKYWSIEAAYRNYLKEFSKHFPEYKDYDG